jgi:uncharacterized protein
MLPRYLLDTNVLIACISSKSPHYWIWLNLTQYKSFTLCVTTDILEEYEEILQRFYGEAAATAVMETLMNLPNVLRIARYYRWNFIYADPDDDKFVDCAIAAQAQFIVTEDNHFKALKKLPFPIAIKIAKFKEIMGV